MAKRQIERGATSVILHVKILDNTSTTGVGKTGLVFNSAGLVAKKIRDGETLVSLTLEDITTLGTYQAPTSNAHIRFKELNSADPTKGVYEIHIHNDWVDTTNSRRALMFFLAGATGMVELAVEIGLFSFNDYADGLLKRDMSAVSGEAARSPLNALRRLRNYSEFLTDGSVVIKKEDDSTNAWTGTWTASAKVDPA